MQLIQKYHIFFLLLFSIGISAQSNSKICIASNGGREKHEIILTKTDSTKTNEKISILIDSLNNLGYLNPKIKNYLEGDSIRVYSIDPGVQYKWMNLRISNDKKHIFSNQRIDISNWEGQYISPLEISKISEKTLDYLDNNGYPFAQINLDSIKFIGEDSISAKYAIKLNKKFYFDTIKIVSDIDLSSGFIQNYLDIKKGDIFNKKKISQISKRIKNLPFVVLSSPPFVSFYGNEASINLDLKPKKINRFDFILGLIPNKEITKKYKITGEITAELINKLGKGERLYFKYKNLSKGKQNLKLDANYPYILNTSYGLDTKFHLYINEDKYIDVNFNLGIQYLFKGINYIKTYWSIFSSRLINVDTKTMLGTGRLPNQLDISTNSLGLQLNYNNLDYRFNPGKGYEAILDGNIGQKKIKKNQQIIGLKNESIDFANSYDTLKLTTYVFNLSGKFSYYHPIAKRFVLKVATEMSWKKAEKNLFQNELFRLGGNKILRGFDEESIFGDLYNITTAEFRLLIDKNSFLFTFIDYGIIHEPFFTGKKWDYPFGFGAGINFDTKGGILSLSTAVGSQHGNPLDFKDVKIHIGYISLF